MTLPLAAFLLAVSTAPSSWAQTLSLGPGEAVTLRIGRGGKVAAVERGPVSMTSFEAQAMAALLRGAGYDSGPNLRELTSRHLDEAPPIAKERLRIKFFRLSDGGSALWIENGYRKAFAYRATIRAGARSAPTDVCLVTPRLRGNEHWPFRIDSIELSAMRLESWREGDPIRCE